MFEVCLEYKYCTRYFHDVKSIKIIDNRLYLHCDYGMIGILDASEIENINIYRLTEDNNEH